MSARLKSVESAENRFAIIAGATGSHSVPGVDYGRLSQIGNRGARLAKLVARLQHGGWIGERELAIYLLCQDYGLSYRSACRHLKAGTSPAKLRKIGNDGKSYPVGGTGRVRGPVEKNLRMALQALNRAFRQADARELCAEENELLEEIGRLANFVVERKGAA